MIDFLNNVKSLIKLDKIHTDNNVFRLHYKFTVIILIVFSILLTSKQYFGDPIDCDIEEGSKKSPINSYCWIFGTYIIKETLNEPILSGLGNYPVNDASPYIQNRQIPANQEDEIITYKYYQWVCIFFLVQSLCFYIPRYLWKSWEAGRLRLLVKDLGGPVVLPTWNSDAKEGIITYFLSGKYSHNSYALRFAFCELLNLFNVCFQIGFIDWFLTGNFSGYGVALMFTRNINPMTMVFPKVTKCNYYKYGPSGSQQKHDFLCVLPLNVVNEKLFMFLWFWFGFLAILSFLQILYRMVVIVSPKFRSMLLQARCRYLSKKYSNAIMKKLSFGDMFFLDLLSQNMNPISFKELVIAMGSTLMEKTPLPYNPEVTIAI